VSPDNDRVEGNRPGILRRIGRAAVFPWRSLRIDERVARLRHELDEVRSDNRAVQSRVRLDDGGEFDVDAMAFLHGQGRRTFEETLEGRRRSTARNTWIFLGLGTMFFLAWLYRLLTMTWTVNATLTALQFRRPARCSSCSRFGSGSRTIRSDSVGKSGSWSSWGRRTVFGRADKKAQEPLKQRAVHPMRRPFSYRLGKSCDLSLTR
jgi:hypothetical protein